MNYEKRLAQLILGRKQPEPLALMLHYPIQVATEALQVFRVYCLVQIDGMTVEEQ